MKDVFARSSVYPFILWSSPFLAVECFCFLSSRSSLLCSFLLSSSVCSFNSRRPQNTVSLTPHYFVHRSKVGLGTKTNSSPPHRASLLTELPKREAKRGLRPTDQSTTDGMCKKIPNVGNENEVSMTFWLSLRHVTRFEDGEARGGLSLGERPNAKTVLSD